MVLKNNFSKFISIKILILILSATPVYNEILNFCDQKIGEMANEEITNELTKKVTPSEITSLTIPANKLNNLEPYFLGSLLSKYNNLKQLSLCSNELKSIDGKIFTNKQNLQYLDLSYNCLNLIPKEIGDLENLESLRICHNKLEKLPKTIRNLKNLKKLHIECNNSLLSLPSFFKQLTSLKNLVIEFDTLAYTTYKKAKKIFKNLKNLEHISIYNINRAFLENCGQEAMEELQSLFYKSTTIHIVLEGHNSGNMDSYKKSFEGTREEQLNVSSKETREIKSVEKRLIKELEGLKIRETEERQKAIEAVNKYFN